MTISNFRSHEPLYIIMVREPNAEKMLKQWAQDSQSQVTIDGNRMKIFEQRSYNLFHMRWNHGWNNVVIWDCWNKRHINVFL
jgi:hypothetical protein